MGKKKSAKKTKELSVAIAESSSTRKRGRPRKIIEKNEGDFVGSESMKGKTYEGDEVKKVEEITQEVEGSSSKSKQEEEKSQDSLAKEQHPPRSSRARRKSRPKRAAEN